MRSLRRTTIDWPGYLAAFHAQRPGITQAVLERSHNNGRNPYQQLLEAIDHNGRILDLACGGAPTHSNHATQWVGIDRSIAELASASHRGADALVLGDATRLPFADDTFDTVVCTMALMLITPTQRGMREIARVQRPGGTLHILLPATEPLSWSDRIRYLRLASALRTTPRFPNSPLDNHAHEALAEAGYTITSEQRCRYRYPITTLEDADRFVNSLYLPDTNRRALQRATTQAERWRGHAIGIPLRNITAVRDTTHRPHNTGTGRPATIREATGERRGSFRNPPGAIPRNSGPEAT